MAWLLNPSHYQLNLYALPLVVTAVAAVSLGFFVMVRERISPLRIPFLAVVISITIWLTAFALMQCALDRRTALFWVKAAYLGVPFIPSAVHQFALNVVSRGGNYRHFARISWWMSVLFCSLALFTEHLISGLYVYEWGFYPKYGPAGAPFFAFFGLMAIFSLFHFAGEYLKSRAGIRRKRLGAFFIAFAIAFAASVDYLPKFGYNVYPFGYLPVCVFLAILAFAIWHYHFVDITPAFAAAQILETMYGAVFVVDLDGTIQLINRSAEEMLGYEAAAVEGALIESVVGSGKMPDFGPFKPEGLHGITLFKDRAMRWKTRQGEPVDVLVSASVVRQEGGYPVGVVYVAIDITSLKRTQEALYKSEARFRSVSQSVNDALISADHAGDIIFWNAGAERIFGYSEAEVLGKNVTILMPPYYKEAHSKGMGRLRDTGEARLLGKTVELYGLRKDGLQVPIELSLSSWNADGKIYFTAVIRDITERKRVQEELQKAHDELEHRVEERTQDLAMANQELKKEIGQRTEAEYALREKSEELAKSNAELQQFAYIASHDMQEPLHKVIVFGDLLKSHSAKLLDAPGLDYVTRMQNAAGRMSRLIDALLQFSKVTTRARPFEQIDLNTVLNEVMADLEVRIRESGGSVQMERLPVLKADRLQMQQLFQNLISNALKFHKKGEPPKVQVQSRNLEGFAEITVQDQGIGFDEKHRDLIFKPFQRLHSRSEYEGSGVGLAICQKIVARHGGRIEAHSKPGEGASFVITLPLGPK